MGRSRYEVDDGRAGTTDKSCGSAEATVDAAMVVASVVGEDAGVG